jgi:hypothetical protein
LPRGFLSRDKPVRQFFTHHGQLRRSLYANSHSTVRNFNDRHGDLVTNQYPLADFSGQN